MTRCLIMAITMMAAALSVAMAAPALRHYGNARFNFWVDYPAGLVAGPEPANGDGREFHLRNGGPGSITASGMYNAAEQTAAQIADDAAQACGGAPPSYRLVKPRLAAVSCVRDGQVYYRKTVIWDDVLVSVTAEYPQSAARTWDPIVRQMAASLRQGSPSR